MHRSWQKSKYPVVDTENPSRPTFATASSNVATSVQNINPSHRNYSQQSVSNYLELFGPEVCSAVFLTIQT
jgi:hypothetical protein